MAPTAGLAIAGSAQTGTSTGPGEDPAHGGFTLAVIPDSQNYLDHTGPLSVRRPFDARFLLEQQLAHIAEHACSNGGEIAFAVAVGDVWQHQSLWIDPESVARGYAVVGNPWLSDVTAPTACTNFFEMPAARAAYALLAGRLPFCVVPGNHDYDAQYSDARWPPTKDAAALDPTDPESIGMLHIGGLENFREVFGATSGFFRDAPWYVASYRGGADSAQLFTGAGRLFLHIGLEMDAPDDALAWASRVVSDYPGLPTIVTTHDFLDSSAARRPNPIVHPKRCDPRHNDPEDVWGKFIARHDQIFLVLCGHEHGEARRVDENAFGHRVHQLLADYQDRNLVALERGLSPTEAEPGSLGDGWLRLLRFELGGRSPSIHVRSYSTYFGAYSSELPRYCAWYKPSEAPALDDGQFLAKGEFSLELSDFRERFPDAARHRLALNAEH